jgi:ribosomal protein S18 acetylase RimI-like enzyme
MAFTVRPARPGDRAGPRLLYLSAQPYYDAYTGAPERSQRMLEAIWPKPGHTAGHDRCRLLEADGEVAGAMVGFPAPEGDALARRFLVVSLLRLAVWRWPHVVRHLRASAEVMPVPPPRSFYVDALAVDPAFRRRGVATALLADAEELAARDGLAGVALDTGLSNRAAQALYEAYGFSVRGERRAPDGRVAAAIGGPGFISYYKPL